MNSRAPRVGLLAGPELQALFETPASLLLLDVREDAERAFCAIRSPAGVVDLHIPMRQIPARHQEICAGALNRAVVVFCHHGVRSMAVAEWLAAQGVERVHNLEGGIDAWSEDVDPSVPRY